MNDTLFGLNVVVDPKMTEPWYAHRFVEYEESDRWWLEKYGYVPNIQRPSSNAIRIGQTLMMHPEMWGKLKTEASRRR